MSHILLREAAEHRRDSLHVAYRGQMTISGHEWGWAISLLRVFWGSNEINNLKDHHSKGNSIKQYKEMCKQNILLKNIDRMFLFIHTLRYWTVFHVIGCCCFWFQTLGESTMDVVMEVAFMPSTADFGFPWWTHLRITKASVLMGHHGLSGPSFSEASRTWSLGEHLHDQGVAEVSGKNFTYSLFCSFYRKSTRSFSSLNVITIPMS